MSSPLVYLILGAAGSGRREVLADLVGGGLASEARPLLLTATGEAAAPEKVRALFDAVPNLLAGTWSLRVGGSIEAEMPDGATHVFFVTDGRGNPIDQIEAFHAWLPMAGLELARIITIVNCQLVHAHKEVLRWYDACVHFSDVVLLNRREELPNKWLSDFSARFHKMHLPCLVELVKKGAVQNPALVLEPQARRISLLFDEPDEWELAAAESGGDDDDDEGDDKTPNADDVDDKDLIGGVDPYLERQAGSGRREKEIPVIAKFLAAVDGASTASVVPPK